MDLARVKNARQRDYLKLAGNNCETKLDLFTAVGLIQLNNKRETNRLCRMGWEWGLTASGRRKPKNCLVY